MAKTMCLTLIQEKNTSVKETKSEMKIEQENDRKFLML